MNGYPDDADRPSEPIGDLDPLPPRPDAWSSAPSNPAPDSVPGADPARDPAADPAPEPPRGPRLDADLDPDFGTDLDPVDVSAPFYAWNAPAPSWDAPPPPGVAPTWGVPQPWEPRPTPRRRWSPAHRALALLAAVALVVAGGAAAFSTQIEDSDSIPSTRAASLDTVGGGVAARVAQGIVNVNTTLSGGGGGAGTGIVISSDGEVLTNNHVISGATSIHVEVGLTGETHSADVLGYAVQDDVALIKINGVSGLKPVQLGDSSQVDVDDGILALGNALGRGGAPAVVQGVVTGLGRTIRASDGTEAGETLTDMIQIAAPIQPGDSGGPVVDSAGRVVGITTAGNARRRVFEGGSSNAGFAIPINRAKAIVRQIQSGDDTQRVHIGTRALLGVLATDAQGSDEFDSDPVASPGALITEVQPGTGAEKIGLERGAVIISVGDTQVTGTAGLHEVLLPYHPGDRVKIVWVDPSGDRHTATARLTAGPPA